MPTLVIPEAKAVIPPTELAECDQVLKRLSAAKKAWTEVSIPERVALLRSCIDTTVAVGEEWVVASCKGKDFAAGSAGEGEEWLGGVLPTVRNLRLLIEALEAGGQPPLPGLRQTKDGQWIARVFPGNLQDKVLFTGYTADIWIEPGEEPTQGRIYRDKASGKSSEGCLALVLGAGNQSSIGPMDALYKLFIEDEVVCLKMNPVNEYLGPVLLKAFQPLADHDVFAVVYGGAEVGKHLCNHPLVDTIHITGSERTHDAIVWGGDRSKHAELKASGKRQNSKPITSELGCVTPILIVPGPWSASDIEFQARHVASMVTHNASFNCNAGKVLLVAKGWAQRDEFLAAVKAKLSAFPGRTAYYPGAKARYEAFVGQYPRAEALGPVTDTVVPWTLIPDVPARDGEYALTNEAFCGIIAQVDLDATTAQEYLAKAVALCNDTIWGTLSCTMIVHPKTRKQAAANVDQAIADLRYGGIGVNVWAGLVYGLVVTTWGAFPGHTLEDIGSGIGVVHNTPMLDHPQKSVIEAPFIIKPTPAWFTDGKNMPALGRKMVKFESAPSWFKVPGVALAAFRS